MLTTLSTGLAGCGGGDRIPVKVEIGVGGRTISKLPFVIAVDQGLFEKYGLDVHLRMPPADHPGAVEVPGFWTKVRVKLGLLDPFVRPDILVDGHTPYLVNVTTKSYDPHPVAIAGTDCVVRMHILGRHGLDSLADLKGKRLGVSASHTTTGFVALLLAERMGWDPRFDLSIIAGRDVDDLREGRVDAIVASETRYAEAMPDGFPVLADTKDWDATIGGNSVLVEPEWLADSVHREAARRFLKATAEGLALFHQRPDLVRDVLRRWYGIRDDEYAETMYERGEWTPRVPYPCYEGIRKTMELYDSHAMRQYTPEDFYDDSFVRELEASGFIAALYDGGQ